jgi:selenocysteine lyase/cysteine desulfurase
MTFSGRTRRAFLGAAAALPVAVSTAGAAASDGERLLDPGALDLEPGLIYFNTASAGPTPRRVLTRTIEAWRKLETNPVPMSYSKEPWSVVSEADRVRGKAAALLGCTAEEILLTSCTSEGMRTLSNGIRLREGDRVLTTDQEHEGGEVGWLYRQRRDGIFVDRVPMPFGDFDSAAIVQRFAAGINARTRVISVSHVLTSSGLRMPIGEIAALARSRGILCIVDGAQAVGEIAVDVKQLGCHAYATSGHKWLMGPKGTGILYVSKDAGEAIEPVQWENSRRYSSDSAGLQPVPLAIGLGEAIDAVSALGMDRIEAHALRLRNLFYEGLAAMPVRLISPPPGPLATALVAFMLPGGIDSLAVRERMLSGHRIVVKMAEKRWFNGNRFSPHVFNSADEVAAALAALRSVIRELGG